MKYVSFYIVMILGIFLLFDMIQLIVRMKHPPYIKYPYKGAKYAIVCFYELSRTGKGSYTEYHYKCIKDKWRYIVNKDNIITAGVLYIILIVGMVAAALCGEIPFITFGITFFTVTILSVVCMIYFPIRGYVFLIKSLQKMKNLI